MTDNPRILVPVDFSECSRRALSTAVRYATLLGYDIDVLHVWEPPGAVTPNTMLWLQRGQTSFWVHVQTSLRTQVEEMIAPYADDAPSFELRVEAGYAADQILHDLQHGAYEMCVLGTHGRTGLDRFVTGSVAALIVRKAPCPVLTVPPTMRKNDDQKEHQTSAHDRRGRRLRA